MILSQLISELQKLQALHGDLPVTYQLGEEPPQEAYNVELSDESWWGALPSGGGATFHTPHIHLS